jgi:hypothetical protein
MRQCFHAGSCFCAPIYTTTSSSAAAAAAASSPSCLSIRARALLHQASSPPGVTNRSDSSSEMMRHGERGRGRAGGGGGEMNPGGPTRARAERTRRTRERRGSRGNRELTRVFERRIGRAPPKSAAAGGGEEENQ